MKKNEGELEYYENGHGRTVRGLGIRGGYWAEKAQIHDVCEWGKAEAVRA